MVTSPSQSTSTTVYIIESDDTTVGNIHPIHIYLLPSTTKAYLVEIEETGAPPPPKPTLQTLGMH